MRILVLLPLLIVLSGCSKAPVAETENKGSQQQEVKEEAKNEEPPTESKPNTDGVKMDDLEFLLGIAYFEGSLYTGKAFKMHDNGQKKAEMNFKNGKPEALVAETQPPAISNELLAAVRKGDEEAVKRQLADGADIAGRDKDGATVLHHAALKGRHEIIKILLKAGGDVNAKMRNNNTPLHMAIFGGAKKDIFLVLLEGGADVNAKGSNGMLSLDVVEYGRSRSSSWKDETIELLRKRGGKTKEELQGIFSHQIKGGALKYQIEGDTTTITDCAGGASGKLVIPAAFEGKSVTSIGKRAFVGCRKLTRITIGNGVTSIGEMAFYNCEGLTSLTIPDGVTSIGSVAFQGCTSLKSITIPDGVTSIGWGAFVGCTSLMSLTIPDSVTSIGKNTFVHCTSLASITIGDSVTSIEGLAFWQCNTLTTVTFLGDAPKVAKDALEGSSSIIYRKPAAKGWGDTFGGRPDKLISEKP